MTSISYLPTIGQAFAITGLAFVGFWSYFFRIYSQVLDYAQILYALSLIFSVGTFSGYLGYSFLGFMPNFLNYCTSGDFSCTYGYLLSPAICWSGGALILLLLVKIIGCNNKNAKFQPVYNFWKGLLRWTMAPLIYFSTKVLIIGLQASPFSFTNDLIASIAVLAFFVVIMLVELIGYKLTQKQEQNNWKKWLQYFSHLRITFIMVILIISSQINSLAKYFIYGPITIYFVLYLWKYKFTLRVLQRLFFFLEEAIITTLYSIFIFSPSYIDQYSLDFFGLAIVIVLEIILFLPKICNYYSRDGEDADASVNPEVKLRDRNIRDSTPGYHNNFQAQVSYENLNQISVTSPRKRLEKSGKR